MESLILFRRFFVYTCAFVGAGWFGYAMYVFAHIHIPTAYRWIIGAAVVVAGFLTYLEPLLRRASATGR